FLSSAFIRALAAGADLLAEIQPLASTNPAIRQAVAEAERIRRLAGPAGQTRVFASVSEVLHAHAQKNLAVHTPTRVRLPARATPVEEPGGQPQPTAGRVRTTVGRVIFNETVEPEAYRPGGRPRMPFYNLPLDRPQLDRVLKDSHALLGRRHTAQLLDRLKR